MGVAVLKNCPICQKQATEKFRPFCSSRCANLDLGKWLNESYSVPAEEEDMPDDGKENTDA